MSDTLLPCPFCGGDAEQDHHEAFRALHDGELGEAVTIYCTRCTARVEMCHADHPEYAPEDMMTILAEAWNSRTGGAETMPQVSIGQKVKVVG